jgi:riboflavin kinase/FMN adenylyltransferase
VISSTRIRKAIAAGQVAEAAKDLGRYYDLHGTVVHGDGRGRKINIPTANINMPSGKVLPANGIYACRAWLSEGNEENKVMFAAATNVGIRPTFTPDLLIPVIEAHLLDFEGNLYDRQIRLEFVEYLRPEEKYRSVDALVKQIQSDIESTRRIISRLR